MVQLFRFISLALLLSLGKGTVGSAESSSSVSDAFTRMNGVYLFGDDSTTTGFKGISLSKCEAVCLNDNLCKAYNFIQEKQWCFPKYKIGKAIDNTNVISGIRIMPLEFINKIHSKLNDLYGYGACNLRELYDDWNGIDYINLENSVRLYTVLCDSGYSSNYIWLKSTPGSTESENGNEITYTHYEPVYFPFPKNLDETIQDNGINFISTYKFDHNFKQHGDSSPKENFDLQSNTISSTYCNNNHCEFATSFTWKYTATNGFILTKIYIDTESGFDRDWNIKLTPAFVDNNIINK